MSADELHRHLNQLITDENVNPHDNSKGIGRYRITTKGAKLVYDGGYKESYDERDRLRKMERTQFFLEKVIALCTAIAAIYYLVQLIFGQSAPVSLFHCH